jgi:arylsulfatase A-like enzyme
VTARQRKNILLIIVDCLRADFVYEPRKAYTPNIDELRAGGFSFLNTIAVTSTTTPCLVSLLTGLYPFEHGVRSLSGYGPKKDMVTFPEILSEAGYRTYAEVTGPLVEDIEFLGQFHEYRYREATQTIHSDWGSELLRRFEGHYQEPWFVLLHVWSLHIPRVVLPECDTRRHGRYLYGRAVSSIDRFLGHILRAVGDDTLIVLTSDHGEQIVHSRLDAALRKRGRRLYLGLRHRQLTGLHFAKGMRRIYVGHGYSIYDVLVKVPLVFYGPDGVPVGQTGCQIRQLDIVPTILDLAGVEHGLDVTGRSAVPIMRGQDDQSRDAFLEALGRVIPKKDEWLAGIRVDNRYKYIYSPFREDYREELYDLERDPGENRNIARRRQQVVASLRGKIEAMTAGGARETMGEELDEEEQRQMINRLRGLGYLD